MGNFAERDLAAAVIEMAIVDFIKSGAKDTESLKFLLGHTEISEHWFQQAEMDHLTPKDFTPAMGQRFLNKFKRIKICDTK